MTSSEIEGLIRKMLEKKEALLIQAEEQRSAKEKLEVVLKEKWVPMQNDRLIAHENKLSKVKQIVKLEIAILESVKRYVPEMVVNQIAAGLEKVRKTNNLLCMNSVSHRNDNAEIRKVVGLVNAVYRYNRDIISGYTPSPSIKSKIKSTLMCSKCGEIARKIVANMVETQSVLLPG